MANETMKNHPVGETVGTAGGAVAGMAVGAAVGGPVGAVVGAAVGAVTGGAVGHGVAAAVGHGVAAAFDPGVEDVDAYRFGWESVGNGYASFDAAEPHLKSKWDAVKTNSRLGWTDAVHAVRDGWHRVEKAIPGDADGDGR